MKTYRLIGADGRTYESETKGTLGGHRRLKLYGRLDCANALRYIAAGQYIAQRVFFADEAIAIAAGHRPCAICMPDEYGAWKKDARVATPRSEFPALALTSPNETSALANTSVGSGLFITIGRVKSFVGVAAPGGYKAYLTDGVQKWVELGGGGTMGNLHGLPKQRSKGLGTVTEAWQFARDIFNDNPDLLRAPLDFHRLYSYAPTAELYYNDSLALENL